MCWILFMIKSLRICQLMLQHGQGVVSKKWRHAWLSLNKLKFDQSFWVLKGIDDDWREGSCIINSILFHHNGHVHEFQLFIPDGSCMDHRMLDQWISFLSKNGIQKIALWHVAMTSLRTNMSSYIFRCSELVHLHFDGFFLKPPPTDFAGFPNLKHLALVSCTFIEENFFHTVIGNSKKLVTLKLEDWCGMDHVVIDIPNLQKLTLKGYFESLGFRNVCSSLEDVCISMQLDTIRGIFMNGDIVDAVNLLASSCQLQAIEFNGNLFKVLAAGAFIRSPPITFNHVDLLILIDLDLRDVNVFRCLLYILECCPYIKKLDITVKPFGNVGEPTIGFNYNYKLDHLGEITIKRITGSGAELKLIEYLLAISTSLENLFFKSDRRDIKSQLKMSRALMRLPRASPKASLVCLEI